MTFLILLMIKILHYLKDPKLWELWVYSSLWVMQDFDHQPYSPDMEPEISGRRGEQTEARSQGDLLSRNPSNKGASGFRILGF